MVVESRCEVRRRRVQESGVNLRICGGGFREDSRGDGDAGIIEFRGTENCREGTRVIGELLDEDT